MPTELIQATRELVEELNRQSASGLITRRALGLLGTVQRLLNGLPLGEQEAVPEFARTPCDFGAIGGKRKEGPEAL